MPNSQLETQDTNGKMPNSQLDTTNESQEVSPFQAGDHKAQKRDVHKCIETKMMQNMYFKNALHIQLVSQKIVRFQTLVAHHIQQRLTRNTLRHISITSQDLLIGRAFLHLPFTADWVALPNCTPVHMGLNLR